MTALHQIKRSLTVQWGWRTGLVLLFLLLKLCGARAGIWPARNSIAILTVILSLVWGLWIYRQMLRDLVQHSQSAPLPDKERQDFLERVKRSWEFSLNSLLAPVALGIISKTHSVELTLTSLIGLLIFRMRAFRAVFQLLEKIG